MIKNKKAVNVVIVVSLLIAFSIITFYVLYNWYVSQEDDLRIKISNQEIDRSLEVREISDTVLTIKNTFKDQLQVDSIKVHGKECLSSPVTISQGLADIDIGMCTEGLTAFESYDVVVKTTSGTLSEVEPIINPVNGSFIVKFVFGGCDIAGGYIRLFGLTDIENAHAEIDSSSTYSVCARHINYTLSTASAGNFQNLLYLTQPSNSAVFTSKTSIYQAPSQWYDISIASSSGIIDYVIGGPKPTSKHQCIGKIDQDDVLGSHIGNCKSSLPDTLWLSVSS